MTGMGHAGLGEQGAAHPEACQGVGFDRFPEKLKSLIQSSLFGGSPSENLRTAFFLRVRHPALTCFEQASGRGIVLRHSADEGSIKLIEVEIESVRKQEERACSGQI